MNYTAKYQEVKSVFKPDQDFSDFSDEEISCRWIHFQSVNVNTINRERKSSRYSFSASASLNNDDVGENQSFTYPVFYRDKGIKGHSNPVILLHGLNERSWLKYLVWAIYLAHQTDRPVILFPIAFHMNRSPSSWGSPREMAPMLDSRRQKLGNPLLSTVANVALSERLSDNPLRFYTSGSQSAADIIQLLLQLKAGNHPVLPASRQVDFFAYSIGAFLAQILMIGNPSGLFAESRLFLFCGGAFFNQMNGVSKLIMDETAFHRLRKFYMNELDSEMKQSAALRQSLMSTELGQAFMAMLSFDYNTQYRHDCLHRLNNQIFTLALEKDRVIPAAAIQQAMGAMKNVMVQDFPYPYIHENPFPVYTDSHDRAHVDQAFEDVFSMAAKFFS